MVVLGFPLGLWSVYCHVPATLTVSDMGFIAWNGPSIQFEKFVLLLHQKMVLCEARSWADDSLW